MTFGPVTDGPPMGDILPILADGGGQPAATEPVVSHGDMPLATPRVPEAAKATEASAAKEVESAGEEKEVEDSTVLSLIPEEPLDVCMTPPDNAPDASVASQAQDSVRRDDIFPVEGRLHKPTLVVGSMPQLNNESWPGPRAEPETWTTVSKTTCGIYVLRSNYGVIKLQGLNSSMVLTKPEVTALDHALRLVDAWHQNLTVPISFYQLKGVLFTNVLSKAANGKLILYVALDQACEAIVYLRRFKNVDCSDPIVMRPSVESLGFKLWHARNLARGLRKLNPEQDQ